MSEFTKGEWKVCTWSGEEWPERRMSVNCEGNAIAISPRYSDLESADVRDNFEVMAAAGTAATKLAEMDYDAVKCIEVLPEIVKFMGCVAFSPPPLMDVKYSLAALDLYLHLPIKPRGEK